MHSAEMCPYAHRTLGPGDRAWASQHLAIHRAGRLGGRTPRHADCRSVLARSLIVTSAPASGVYSWRFAGRTLIVTPVADKKCVVRETLFGGRWKR